MERGRQGRLPAVHQRPLIVRALLIGALALGLVAGARDLSRSWFFPLDRSQLDLRVLYCGGRAANAGADPYALEPIRTCEHEFPTRLMVASPNLAFPFTLPGYDLGPIELLARLPIGAASAVFTVLSLLALAGAIALVARTLDLAWWIPAAALTLSVGFTSLPLGQSGAFELLALAATGWALTTGRDRWAAAFGVLTLLEPHVGAFVVITLAALVPRARAGLAIGCAVLLALALTWSTLGAQIDYLTVFLPGQASSEVHSSQQYGLTYLLATFGVPDGAALVLGTVWTLAMLVVAVPLARATATIGPRAAIAFVPAACAVTLGTYMHATQEALAVPAALLLAAFAPNRLCAVLAGAAAVLLAVPWSFPAGTKQLLVICLVCIALMSWFATSGRLPIVIAAVAASWLGLFWAENHLPPALRIPVVPRWPASTPITVESRAAIAQTARSEPYDVAIKIPTWCGLLAVLGAGASVVKR